MRPKKDGMEKFTPEARINEYLKKPLDADSIRKDAERQLTAEESKQLARDQILKRQRLWSWSTWETFHEKVVRNIIWRSSILRKLGMKKFSYETLPIIVFCSVSIFIAWKMEDRLDQMKRKVVRIKTFREEEAERENKLITGVLSGNQDYEDMPISTKADPLAKYRLDASEDPQEHSLVQNPNQEYAQPDLSPEEMAKMMEQYRQRSKRLTGGSRLLPNPGYSLNPEENRANRDRQRPGIDL